MIDKEIKLTKNKTKPRKKKIEAKKMPKSASNDVIINSAPKEQRFKERWNALNNDVHSALCNWNDLTEKYNGKLSREDQQLLEIKSLLKELQDKLKIFND